MILVTNAMKTIDSALAHKIIPPRRASAGPSPVLILLHGRGANEDDLLGLSSYLDEHFFLAAPRAPYTFQWGGGFTWYDMEEAGSPEPQMFAESYDRLSTFLDDVRKGYPVDPSRMLLFGFSMGTVMSYCIALTKPAGIAGVIAHSGYIPEDAGLRFAWGELEGKAFFIAHGTDDPVIPVSFSRRARELLSPTRALITYREYTMGHQISDESLGDAINWMADRLAAAGIPTAP